jgi:hypothetical protein
MVVLALRYLVGKAEAAVVVHNQWESWAIAVINTVILNTPQVFLFIALSLLALQGLGEERPIGAKSEISWGSQLSVRVRRAREWKGDSF